LNRRLLSLAAAVMIIAAACGSSGGGGSSDKVKLTLWHNYGTEANATVTKNLTDAYTKANPNVTFELVSQPADNYFALLKAAAISKTGPDLITMWTGLFALQNQGYLATLNDMIPVETLKKFTGINWCSRDLNVDKGAICVPLDMQFYNGFYNKDLFKQAGVDKVPTNWDEMYAACDKFKAAGIQGFAYGTGGQALNAGFYPYYDLSYMMMFMPVEDWKKLYSGEMAWDDPKVVAQLANWAKLREIGCTNEDVLTNTESVAQFEAGKAAMTLEGSWDFQEFNEKMGDNVGVFLPPFTTEAINGVVEFPGNGFGVTSYSKNQKAAADFLAWMATADAQKIIADGGLIPTVAGNEPSAPLAIEAIKLGETVATKYPMIDNVMQPQVVDVATKVLNAVLAGTMTPEEAAKAMADAVAALPAENRGAEYK
jgi:ABC-type glycerol-3-phosphate transport system substrate-binding protein